MNWYRLTGGESIVVLRVENGIVQHTPGFRDEYVDKTLEEVQEEADKRGWKLERVE